MTKGAAYAMAITFVLGVGIGYGASLPSQRGRLATVERLQNHLDVAQERLEHAAGIIGELGETVDRLTDRQREIDAVIESTAAGLHRATATARTNSDLIRAIWASVNRLEELYTGPGAFYPID